MSKYFYLLILVGFQIAYSEINNTTCQRSTQAGVTLSTIFGVESPTSSDFATQVTTAYSEYRTTYPTRYPISMQFSSGAHYQCHYYVEYINHSNGVSDSMKCECTEHLPTSYSIPVGMLSAGSMNCAWMQPTIINVTCIDMGAENPLLPKNGVPTTNGRWVRLKYITVSAYGDTSDTTFETVLSGGCDAVTFNGDTVERQNAHDICDSVDGIRTCNCAYMGQILSGSCAENGLDTTCMGQLNFHLTNKNDSIINDCIVDDSVPGQRPDDSLPPAGDSALTGNQYNNGANQISSDLRNEHALDREAMKKQLDQSIEQTGLLGKILNGVLSVNQSIKNIFNKMVDSTNLPSVSGYSGIMGDTSGTGYIDTGNVVSGDTGTLFSSIRNKYAADTSDTALDTSGVGTRIDSVFSPFIVNFYESDCDCNDEWLKLTNFPFVGDLYIDICPYQLDVIMKPILKFIAVFILFVFYREFFIKTIMDSF